MDSKEKQTQADKFRDAAKELKTDDDEKQFERLVKRLAKSKPEEKD